MRMHRSGIRTKLVWVSEDSREESLEMLERLKMSGVVVDRVDPWSSEGKKADDFMDRCDF